MAQKPQPASINSIEFDALISYGRNYEAQAPEYPVEEGYSIGDTIIIKPMTIDVTAMLSAAPVTFYRRHGAGRGRVEEVARKLQSLYEKRELVTLTTFRGVYRNMAIESMSLPYSADTGSSMQVTMKLKQVVKVGSKTTAIPASYGKSGETGANAGTASTAPLTSNTSASGQNQQKADSQKACSTLYGAGNMAKEALEGMFEWMKGW